MKTTLFMPTGQGNPELTKADETSMRREQEKLRNQIAAKKAALERLILRLVEVNDALGETPDVDMRSYICGE